MSKNAVVWMDIPAVDLDRAIGFYTAVLGAPVSLQNHEGFAFALLPHAEDGVSGCIFGGPDAKPSAEGVLVYLNVEGRLDDAVAQVASNGGTVQMGKHEIGPYGFRAVILDSEGNRVALHSQTA